MMRTRVLRNAVSFLIEFLTVRDTRTQCRILDEVVIRGFEFDMVFASRSKCGRTGVM